MGSIEERISRLEVQARDVRLHIVKMIHAAQSGHPGGSLSAADIMTALYFDVMHIDPENPHDPDRDRFVLSKGHACPVWYTCLALRGFFPVEELCTLRRTGTRLQGHPVAGKLPGIDATTGSLGIGFGQAIGMALEAKMTGKAYRVYTVLGDGELNEGLIWEACNTANKYCLDNITAVVDCNRLQNDGFGRDIMPMEPLEDKFAAFGWKVRRVNGHNMKELIDVLDDAKRGMGKPFVIIADTVKGRGVSFMENVRGWHGKAPNADEYKRAVDEIRGVQ
ncbi:transketolase [Treponema sp. OttesenSCG-928-L16]|nr:transketolase [Treponema sp. OttesenSCG-928-L16]